MRCFGIKSNPGNWKKHNEEVVGLAIENMHPIPKIGQGEDFGNLSSFLLSEKITGLLDKFYILMEVDQH